MADVAIFNIMKNVWFNGGSVLRTLFIEQLASMKYSVMPNITCFRRQSILACISVESNNEIFIASYSKR